MATTESVTGTPGGSTAPGGAPTTIAGLRTFIRTARDRLDKSAMRRQKQALLFGAFSISLVPVAVILLTVEILTCSRYECRPSASTVLIGFELVLLLAAVLIALLGLRPSSRGWAQDRVRAELLRREEFLLISRVGPYLTKSALPVLEAEVKDRVERIERARDPSQLVPLGPPGPSSWRDQLETMLAALSTAPEPDALSDYLDNRVKDQRNWYSGKSEVLLRTDRIYEVISGLILIFALVLAAAHFVMVLPDFPSKYERGRLLVEILAITLPPIGAAVAALQSFLQNRRLSYSYGFHSMGLDGLAHELSDLQRKSATGVTPATDPQCRLEFKRLVLQAEGLFASEMSQWYFVMRPDKPPIP
jgi:hypothetical protein